MAQAVSEHSGRRPSILTVPGLGGSGPGHWQTLWEQTRGDTARVDLGMWDTPRRNPWVTKLDQAIRQAEAPVILVAHSLGCHAVAWWAELAGQPWGWPIAGALLVAPPDVDRAAACAQVRGFAPTARPLLPFPAIVVASENDPHADLQRSFDMARDWGAHFIDVGAQGHINAASGLGLWHEGQALLERLIGAVEGPMAQGGSFAEVLALLAGDRAGVRAGA